MKTKKVNRYWCDFCNKAGLQKHAMQKHEDHCTMNPNRKCRMCVFVAGTNQPSITAEDAKAMLPALPDFASDDVYQVWRENISAVIPKLRDHVQNCPACIMFALRQANIPVPMVEDFDFTKECKAIFETVNEERQESYGIQGIYY